MVQVTVETTIEEPALERVAESVKQCDRLGLAAAVAISGRDNASDSRLFADRRVRLQGRASKAIIVMHPSPAEERNRSIGGGRCWWSRRQRDCMDVRVALRLNGPVTPR